MLRLLSALLVAALASTAAATTANAATIHYLIKAVIDANIADGPPPLAVGEEIVLYSRIDPRPATHDPMDFDGTSYLGGFSATDPTSRPYTPPSYGGSVFVRSRPAAGDLVWINAGGDSPSGGGYQIDMFFGAPSGTLPDESIPDLVSLMQPGWTNFFRFHGGGEILEHGHITSIELLPSPIPAALPLFVSALGGLWLVSRRRRVVT